MQIPILIERVAGNGYRARGGEPLPLVAEGSTREEALANLNERLQARLRDGTELISVDVTTAPHPLAEFAGMFKDDPYFDDVVEIMAENRRKWTRTRKFHEPDHLGHRRPDAVDNGGPGFLFQSQNFLIRCLPEFSRSHFLAASGFRD